MVNPAESRCVDLKRWLGTTAILVLVYVTGCHCGVARSIAGALCAKGINHSCKHQGTTTLLATLDIVTGK